MAPDFFGLPAGLYGLDTASEVFRFLVLVLALGFFVHLAAKIVIDRSTIAEALVAVVVGLLVAVLVQRLVTVDLLGAILGLVAFIFLVAAVYRVKWLKGAAIGAMAWVLWRVVSLVLDWLTSRF